MREDSCTNVSIFSWPRPMPLYCSTKVDKSMFVQKPNGYRFARVVSMERDQISLIECHWRKWKAVCVTVRLDCLAAHCEQIDETRSRDRRCEGRRGFDQDSFVPRDPFPQRPKDRVCDFTSWPVSTWAPRSPCYFCLGRTSL